MKSIEYNIHRSPNEISIKIFTSMTRLGLAIFVMALSACTDFVEVDPPRNLLISETVFNDPATVESAFSNIFYKIREQGMVSGNFGLTITMGIYSDELDYHGVDISYLELYNHTVMPSNNTLLAWWKHTYNLIYCANDIIKGVENSNTLTSEEVRKFKGQALFLRGYLHSLLANVYGDIPYVTTTDYIANNLVSRLPIDDVYNAVISDLTMAMELLEDSPSSSGEHLVTSQDVVKALLARIYMYTEQWDLAVVMSSEMINEYTLETEVTDVFLKSSSETIWQLKPGISPKNTQEAIQLIIQNIPGQKYAMAEPLLASFEEGDLRLTNWVGRISNTDNTMTLYFANKYKAGFTIMESLEYSILFRLAEQYLIRAEARTKLGDLSGAQQDLNVIRNRAGLVNTTAINQNELLKAILQERRVELFAEQGHRWFDLKRTGNASDALAPIKPNWQPTDLLLPIPEAELQLNPNLLPQNSGY